MSLYNKIKDAADTRDAFWFHINRNTRQKRFLLSAMLELSPICNFSCPFCYVRRTPKELADEGKNILRYDYWANIIDQLAEMNVMSLSFTGGECMLHPDFCEIYRHAIDKKMVVSMISNGSCLNDEILNLFIKFPPRIINITMYGASSETYEAVCGNNTFYERVLMNVRRLTEHHIPVCLQTTISKDNVDDLAAIYGLSRELHTKFGYSGTFIRFQRCTEEIQEINSVDENVLKNTVTNMVREDEIKDPLLSTVVPKPVVNPFGVACSAGRNVAFINHEGKIQPCVSFDGIQISTFEHTVEDCWAMIVSACDKIPQITECDGCIHWNKCKHCFAMHYYDTHDFTKPSPRLCFKMLHPEEAARIEAYYAEHGVLPQSEY